MNRATDTHVANDAVEATSGMSRRSFFRSATVAGATGAVALSGVLSMASALGQENENAARDVANSSGLTRGDTDILVAAEIAEALAVTTYTNITRMAPFFRRLPFDDQSYLFAARQEEMSHYLLEESATRQPTPFTKFFYPFNMFASAQVTLNTLVTLEDAFIAAYLVGVRNFSTSDLRVTAARIMGIESDHRTLARVLGSNVVSQDGGPIEKIKGIQGVSENIDPPNNNGYERTLCWTNIGQAVKALLPFVDMAAAKAAGFNTSDAFPFQPFTPKLPTPLGAFISFKGC